MDRRLFLQSAVAAGVLGTFSSRQALASRFAALSAISGDIAAVTGDRAELTLEQAALQELADSLRGNLLLPGNEAYEKARRVLNPGIDKRPALVVQPIGATDIRKAVEFASERNLLLAVKCGGHSYGGKSTCDGGMQIDLSTFRHARVDSKSRTAYVAGGSLLAELDRESMAFGLVTTAGTVSHTGVGGLTTAGGFGRVGRRFGLALDNVKGIDIVTADGALRHASADENPDLFWGVRGGGGNFGIVTSFEFALHPMQRTVVGGEVLFPFSKARDVMRVYRDYGSNAPDELYCDLMISSPMEGADGLAGFHVCWSGDEGGAEKALAPIMAIGEPAMNNIHSRDYVEIQRSWDNTDPRTDAEYLKSGFVNEFSDALIDEIINGFEPLDGRSLMIYLQHSGGAIGRVPKSATAFAQRDSIANMLLVVGWPMLDDASSHVSYIRRYWDALEPMTDGYYSVDTDKESEAVRHGNYGDNFPRLREIKKKYDPANLFRLNANIKV
ncbi:MAG: FAD-binding oxidoreductase [Gammaproteobacteria bacterium]|nr:FAD-binding oxidoreductase [Gammaproteobacteria bacterium]